ncbi:hypothetical protein OH492_25985 [Vibrio chagasii]|nr:hypothetical protein [Vibrio chagasii]
MTVSENGGICHGRGGFPVVCKTTRWLAFPVRTVQTALAITGLQRTKLHHGNARMGKQIGI